MLLSLAFLAPGLVTAIVERRLPRGIGLTQMMDLPADWVEQHRTLGLNPNLFYGGSTSQGFTILAN
jgi:site-specific DNA recombinase